MPREVIRCYLSSFSAVIHAPKNPILYFLPEFAALYRIERTVFFGGPDPFCAVFVDDLFELIRVKLCSATAVAVAINGFKLLSPVTYVDAQLLAATLGIFPLVIGFVLSVVTKDWSWITRFSSVILVSGLLLSMSPVFIRGIYKSQSSSFGYGSLDMNNLPVATNEEDRDLGMSVLCGIVLTIIGTFLNAFGDIVFRNLFCIWMGSLWCVS